MAIGQQVQAHGIAAGASMGAARIVIRTHMWNHWARIAMKHEAMAQAARRDAWRLLAVVNPSPALQQEADAALVCVSAAAFALEALYRGFLHREFNLVSQQDQDAWTRNRTAGRKRALETLRRGFDLKGIQAAWQAELRWLFGLRVDAVHFTEDWKEPAPHPLGNNAAPELVAYSAESAERAIDLLVGVLVVCRDKPRTPKVQAWSAGKRQTIDDLIGRRGKTS